MRVVDKLELVLRGEMYPFESELGAYEELNGGKRSYLVDSSSPVLERLRSENFFAEDQGVYISLAYQTTRADEPSFVVDGKGEAIRPYRKSDPRGRDTILRWVKKTMFLGDEGHGKVKVTGWRLNMAMKGMVENTLTMDVAEGGAEWVEKFVNGEVV
jgi:hypothetical protein